MNFTNLMNSEITDITKQNDVGVLTGTILADSTDSILIYVWDQNVVCSRIPFIGNSSEPCLLFKAIQNPF